VKPQQITAVLSRFMKPRVLNSNVSSNAEHDCYFISLLSESKKELFVDFSVLSPGWKQLAVLKKVRPSMTA